MRPLQITMHSVYRGVSYSMHTWDCIARVTNRASSLVSISHVNMLVHDGIGSFSITNTLPLCSPLLLDLIPNQSVTSSANLVAHSPSSMLIAELECILHERNGARKRRVSSYSLLSSPEGYRYQTLH